MKYLLIKSLSLYLVPDDLVSLSGYKNRKKNRKREKKEESTNKLIFFSKYPLWFSKFNVRTDLILYGV